MARIELTFPLAPDECTARLAAATNRNHTLFFETEPKAVYGRVEAGRVRVWKRIDSRNPFQMCLSGAFEPRGSVTVFRGRTGRDVSSWCALAVYALNMLSSLVLLIVALNSTSPGINRWLPLVFLFAIVVGTFSLWRDWHKARGEGTFLVEFLTRTLGGTVRASEPEGHWPRTDAGAPFSSRARLFVASGSHGRPPRGGGRRNGHTERGRATDDRSRMADV